jgi:hypothetical protein
VNDFGDRIGAIGAVGEAKNSAALAGRLDKGVVVGMDEGEDNGGHVEGVTKSPVQ